MSKPGPVIRVMKRSPEKSQCCLTADIARSDHGQIQDNSQVLTNMFKGIHTVKFSMVNPIYKLP
uniref:Uncharacterized protein n=1 Tax=Oryza rufipogon TaxID=4529 RepID=A0A0E0PNC5_ORYRU